MVIHHFCWCWMLLTWEPLLVTQCWAEMIWTRCLVRGFTVHVSVIQSEHYFCPHCRFVSWQKSPKSHFQQKLIFSIWDINFLFIKVLFNYSGDLERPKLLINYQLLGYLCSEVSWVTARLLLLQRTVPSLKKQSLSVPYLHLTWVVQMSHPYISSRGNKNLQLWLSTKLRISGPLFNISYGWLRVSHTIHHKNNDQKIIKI